jgi:hypothetical protein
MLKFFLKQMQTSAPQIFIFSIVLCLSLHIQMAPKRTGCLPPSRRSVSTPVTNPRGRRNRQLSVPLAVVRTIRTVQKVRKLISRPLRTLIQSPAVAEAVAGLPETDRQLNIILKEFEEEKRLTRQSGGKAGPVDEDLSGSTSSESEDAKHGVRERLLLRRAKHRCLTSMLGESDGGISLLEKWAVSTKVSTNYQQEVSQFLSFADARHYPLTSDHQIDRALVVYFNHLFFRGEQPDKGEKMLAGLLHRLPEFGKCGSHRIPRSWRALKGWRKICPSRSRRPWPLGVWCLLAHQMVQKGRLDMASYLLLLVSSYVRLGELLRARRQDLLRPMGGAHHRWSLLLTPQKLTARSKIGESDGSVMLDSSWMEWSIPLYEVLKHGDPAEKIWGFSYPQFAKMFKTACASLGRTHMVPYQARHSGPAIDRSSNTRTLQEVQKRGGWQTQLVRYERSARLAASLGLLSTDVSASCNLCELHIG